MIGNSFCCWQDLKPLFHPTDETRLQDCVAVILCLFVPYRIHLFSTCSAFIQKSQWFLIKIQLLKDTKFNDTKQQQHKLMVNPDPIHAESLQTVCSLFLSFFLLGSCCCEVAAHICFHTFRGTHNVCINSHA